MIQIELNKDLPEEEHLKWLEVLNRFLISFISIALTLKLKLIFTLKIGWDEFFYLSKVHSYIDGTLSAQFQTFYVHFFTWLPLISENEVNQVITARLVMYLFFLGSCIYTYLIGRHFFNRSSALFSLLCYVSLSNIVVHAASFRADSLCSFLFLFSVYFIMTKPKSLVWSVIIGFSIALSLMISIKSAFHLVTIGIVLLCLFLISDNKKSVLKQTGVFCLSLLFGFTVFYYIHLSTIAERELLETNTFIKSTSSKVMLFNEFIPGAYFLSSALYENIIIWSLLLFGLVLIVLKLIRSRFDSSSKSLVLIAFTAPLLTLVFYRNAFPYYYVFIIAPAIIYCGVIVHHEIEDFIKTRSFFLISFVFLITIIVFSGSIYHFIKSMSHNNKSQMELIETVHKIFPYKSPYIDGCSAISSFPKHGLFMSTWGMENYLKANTPIMLDILKNKNPTFLFANIPSLDLSLSRENDFTAINYPLLEEDWETLKSNYVHHWSIIYVAGKQFDFSSGEKHRNFDILIEGSYTYEGEDTIVIDGALIEPYDIIKLERSIHTIEPQKTPSKATLRWGEHLYRPQKEPTSIPTFYGF